MAEIETIDETVDRELKELEAFKEKHKTRIDQFVKDNPGKPLPIFQNKDGSPVWLNRKQLRSAKTT